VDENGYVPEPVEWNWQQTENSIDLLMKKLKIYGIEK
jgi:hypothetical protein